MSPVAFLLSAFGICAVGVMLLLLRNRQPSGTIHGVRSFEREMRALDPKRNKVRHDPFGRPHDGLIDLREERISSGVSIVEPAPSSSSVTPTPAARPGPKPTTAPPRISTPSVVVVRPPEPELPPVTGEAVADDAVDGEAVTGEAVTVERDDDVPRADPGEADGPRDEARG
ncbi:MAG: hypothetical protein AB7V43_12790 [Acidimicrobiia bacterium]